MRADPAFPGNSSVFVEPVETHEPAGGLARGEVAELVAIDVDHKVRTNDGGSGTFNDPNTLISIMQWGVDDDFFPNEAGSNVDKDIIDSAGNDVGNRGGQEYNDAGIFWLAGQRVSTHWNNTTDGAGGGEGPGHQHHKENFRAFGGMGPLVDRKEDLQCHGFLQSKGPMDNVAESDAWIRAYWNVVEASDLPDDYRLY